MAKKQRRNEVLRLTKYTRTLSVVVLLFLTILLVFPHKTAFAVSAADWKPGNIIDDGTFFDSGSMSTTDIQNFLNSKVPTCDTNGTKTSEYGGGTRAQYGTSKGYPPPYTCLKSYSQGGLSSAQIIKNAATTYNISPKVLLVLLQKEQTLVTDDWPWSSQYRSATGYGCPDTAPCDAEYYGFTNQVTKAAYQFRRYATYPNDYRYKPFQTNYIQYNPNAACGGSNVYIENLATAGLYNYTPYQPNASALSNLYGSGDSCGAYGNRNFWRLYNDWFGSTQSVPFFSNNGRVYIDGANNDYYYVPNPDTLNAYGVGSVITSIRAVDGNYLQSRSYAGVLPRTARFDDQSIYAFDNGQIHHFETGDDYHAYGYSFGDEAVLPSTIKWHYAESTPMRTILKAIGRSEVYLVENGTKRHIGSWATYTTQGSPTYNSRQSIKLSSSYTNSITNGVPLLISGSIIKNSSTSQYFYNVGDTIYPINSAAISDWGMSVDYTNSSNIISLFTPSGQTTVRSLVKSTTGQMYILDNKHKKLVDTSILGALGLNSSSFITAQDSLLNRFRNDTMTTLVMQSDYSPVYELRSGSLYHILSEIDLRGLGYSFSQITTLQPGSMGLFHYDVTNTSFMIGRLVKVYNKPEVYVVTSDSTKKHIPNVDIFNNYGFRASDIINVQTSDLTNYTNESVLSRLVKDTGNNYWLINSGYRLPFPTSLIPDFGLSTSGFSSLSQDIINRLPATSQVTNLVRASNSNKVYKVESASKHWVTTQSAFTASSLSWSNVRVLAPGFVDSIPSGSNIN